MSKEKFIDNVNFGVKRNKNYMVVKIKSSSDFDYKLVIVQKHDIIHTMKKYISSTDEDMTFKDSGDQIIDVLMTSNLNDLFWFVY